MTAVARRQPGEETCPYCEPAGTFGLAHVGDKRFLGGHVDHAGLRHDPLRHAEGCPTVRFTERNDLPGEPVFE